MRPADLLAGPRSETEVAQNLPARAGAHDAQQKPHRTSARARARTSCGETETAQNLSTRAGAPEIGMFSLVKERRSCFRFVQGIMRATGAKEMGPFSLRGADRPALGIPKAQ